MLSLFSSRKKDAKVSTTKMPVIKSSQSQRNTQLAMKDAQRETYQYDKPTQELGLTDLIKNHKSGERFLYAAVTANQSEENSSRLRRLIQFQPKLARKQIPVQKLPALPLYNECETFQLQSLIPGGKTNGVKTYINISEVTIVYGSLISSDSIFSKVKVSIVDDRLIQNKVTKSYVANTNVMSKSSMSLSYCFPRDEIDAISLTVSREAAFLEEGRQWGVVQMMIQLEETEFPIQMSNIAVQAINAIPQSMMEERDVDPDTIDISLMDNDRKKLADMFMSGDLADETSPVINRSEAVKYAKSSLAGPKGTKSTAPRAEGWGFMNERRGGMIAAGNNSVDPSEDGDFNDDVSVRDDGVPYRYTPPSPPALKSALKNSSINHDVHSITSSEENRPVSPRRVTVTDPSPLGEFMNR